MIVIVPSNLTTISSFYRAYNTDAAWTGDLTFAPSDVASTAIASFEDLLKAIGRYTDRGETDFIIVAHGDGNGLTLPVVAGSSVRTTVEVLRMLTSYATGQSSLKSSLVSNEWIADGRKATLFKSGDQLTRFMDALKKARAGVYNIHFRACMVGDGPALRALAEVFDAYHAEGPTAFYLYYYRTTGALPRTGLSSAFSQQLSQMSFPRRAYSADDCLLPAGSTPPLGASPAFAINTRLDGQGKPLISAIYAASQAAIEGWTKSFLENSLYYYRGARPPGNGYARGGTLYVFGLDHDDSNNPVVFAGDGYTYLKKLAVVNR